MFNILARTLRTATRTGRDWNAPARWVDHDPRTRAQKERDAAERRRMLRLTGLM